MRRIRPGPRAEAPPEVLFGVHRRIFSGEGLPEGEALLAVRIFRAEGNTGRRKQVQRRRGSGRWAADADYQATIFPHL